MNDNQILYAVWGIRATGIINDKINYYGKIVNYGKGETDYSTSDGKYKGVNWKVFNVSGGSIQLIAADYVDTSELNTNGYESICVGVKLGDESGYTCGLYLKPWDDLLDCENDRRKLINFLNDTAKWSSFIPNGLIGKATAKGGPSLEEFTLSYNATHLSNDDGSNQINYKKTADTMINSSEVDCGYGYYVGFGKFCEEDYSTQVRGLENKSQLEFYHSISDKASGYWLTTSSARSDDEVLVANHWSNLEGAGFSNVAYGVCPLITLSSDTILIDDGNGRYDIMINN